MDEFLAASIACACGEEFPQTVTLNNGNGVIRWIITNSYNGQKIAEGETTFEKWRKMCYEKIKYKNS